METFGKLLSLFGILLTGFDLIGEQRLRSIEFKLRTRIDGIRNSPEKYIHSLFMPITAIAPEEEPVWAIPMKYHFWLGTILGATYALIFFVFLFSSAIDTLFFVWLAPNWYYPIVISLGAIVVSIIFPTLGKLFIAIIYFIVGLTIMGIGLLFLSIWGLVFWLMLQVYVYVDELVKRYKLKSSIWAIGLFFTALGLIIS